MLDAPDTYTICFERVGLDHVARGSFQVPRGKKLRAWRIFQALAMKVPDNTIWYSRLPDDHPARKEPTTT